MRLKLRKGEEWQALKLERLGYCFGDDGDGDGNGDDNNSYDTGPNTASQETQDNMSAANDEASIEANGLTAQEQAAMNPANTYGPGNPTYDALEEAGKNNPAVDLTDPDQAPTGLSLADQNSTALSAASQAALGHSTKGNEGLGLGLDDMAPGDSKGMTDAQASKYTQDEVTSRQQTLAWWNAVSKALAFVGKLGIPGASAAGQAISAGTKAAQALGYDSVAAAWGSKDSPANNGSFGNDGEGSGGGNSTTSAATTSGAGLTNTMGLDSTGGITTRYNADGSIQGGSGVPTATTATNPAATTDAYSWFKNLYGDLATERAKVSTAAGNAQTTANSASALNLGSATTDRATYDQTFTPTLKKIVADANAFDSTAEAERLAQEGEATVGKQFGQMRGQREREIQSLGINPNSLKYRPGLDALDSDEASAKAAASNDGRIKGRDIGTQRLVQAAGLSAPLAGQATTEANAGVIASQAGLQAAQVPGATERADSALVATGAQLNNQAVSTANNFELGKLSAANSTANTNAAIAASGAKTAAAQAAQEAEDNQNTNAAIGAIASNAGTIASAAKTIWDWF